MCLTSDTVHDMIIGNDTKILIVSNLDNVPYMSFPDDNVNKYYLIWQPNGIKYGNEDEHYFLVHNQLDNSYRIKLYTITIC